MAKQGTLDQLRARHAWDAVSTVVKNTNDVLRESFAREVKRLPVRIRTAGLGQALGFLYAKKGDKNANALLLKELSDWLLVHRDILDQSPSHISPKSILDAIVKNDSDFLRRSTDEILMYLQWLGRFTEAEIKQDS